MGIENIDVKLAKFGLKELSKKFTTLVIVCLM
jgi:hypothetical protein